MTKPSGQRNAKELSSAALAWYVFVMTLFSYTIAAYNWNVLFNSGLINAPWATIERRCYIGLTLTVLVGFASTYTGAILKLHAKRMTSAREVNISYATAWIAFGTQAALVVKIFTEPSSDPLLTTTRALMVLAQSTVAGWILKIFWDRVTEMVGAEMQPPKKPAYKAMPWRRRSGRGQPKALSRPVVSPLVEDPETKSGKELLRIDTKPARNAIQQAISFFSKLIE